MNHLSPVLARGRRLGHAAMAVAACILAVVAVAPLHAAENITLRNGFELTCDHRGSAPPAETLAGSPVQAPASESSGTVRLFLDAGEANYIDVRPADIVADVVADVVAPSPAAARKPEIARQAKPAQADLSPSELRQLLASAGTDHNLDVDLLASVVHAESNSHTRAVSRTGAEGLMQLMPGTAAELGVKDSFAPEDNVHGGTAYLDSLLKRYHDNLALALAAYNAGPGAVDRYHGVPPYRETRAYVERIIHEFNQRYAARQAAAGLALAR